MNIQQLFFELIQVAIGNHVCLSHTPSTDEWGELYAMAKKQSLVGVCFAGVQRLSSASYDNENEDENNHPDNSINHKPLTINLPEMLYLTWMGMAAKIQQRNEVVNRQCVELQAKLAADGLRSSILKGQGVASLYSEHLRGLRQSGDIDVWVNASKDKVVAWAEKVGMTEKPGYLHVGARCFQGTEVELHYRPTYRRCLWYNKRLQEFCESHMNDWTERNEIVVSSWEFDVVYQLSHIYRHLFGLGIGLRQLMDYYWTLSNSPLKGENTDLQNTLKYLGLYDFAGAVMYVLREVFIGNDNDDDNDNMFLGIKPDERRGRMLLDMVMQTGNFGHQDEKQREARSTAVGSLKYKVKQWWQLVSLYPEETLSAPIWVVYKRLKG